MSYPDRILRVAGLAMTIVFASSCSSGPSAGSPPDGLVFERVRRGDSDIVLVEDGQTQDLLGSSFDESEPVWSPDGAWIAFSSDMDGDFDIYVVRPDGTDVSKITDNDLDDTDPDWSPDGKYLVFSGEEGGEISPLDLYTISRAGGDAAFRRSNR